MVKKQKNGKILKKSDPLLEWTLGAELGKGTFGEVYVATDKSGTVAAAKICTISCEGDFNDMKQEAEILSSCDNLYILKAYSCYTWGETIWMVLELCEGGSLENICVSLEGFDEPTIRLIMYQCTLGLQYLHNKGIIHRDIKLGNIMLTDKGICKIADFGVSAVVESQDDKRGTFIGTPYWMAPEVILTETHYNYKYNNKCDIYSLGITACECAEKLPPGWELSPAQILLSRLRSSSPELEEASRWTNNFKKWIAASLTKDPLKRPSATQLLKLPFLMGEDLNKTDLLFELYRISKALVVEEEDEEEDQEEDQEEAEDQDAMEERIEIDLDDVHTPVEILPPRKEKEEPFIPRVLTRTVKKTYRYNVNGVEKTKEVIKSVENESKENKMLYKSKKEKDIKQMKLFVIQQRHEKSKLEEMQKNQINDLIARQKTEYDVAVSRYLTELDVQGKFVSKEIDKKLAQLKGEIDKWVKKAKIDVEKGIKIHQQAMRSKNPSKYNQSYIDPDYITNINTAKRREFEQFHYSQCEALSEHSIHLVNVKNNHLEEIVKALVVLRLQQLNEVFTIKRGQITLHLELVLQQRVKLSQTDLQISLRCRQEIINNVKAEQARYIRDMPKLLRQEIRKNVESYKKTLRRNKVRNEKELVQKHQAELTDNMDNRINSKKMEHEAIIKDLEQSQEKLVKDMQEFEEARNRAIHQHHQDQLYRRYVEDEQICKEELFKLYLIAKRHQQDYESELQAHRDIRINISCHDIFK